MTPRIWIVLVNFNGLADTRKCLQSISEAGWPDSIFTVLVDNASAEDPTEVLRAEFPWCHQVRNKVNGGWAGGNNTGIRYALDRGADQVLLLNNDTVVAPGLAPRLLEAMAAHPEFGILGPVIRFMDDPNETMTDGCIFNAAHYNGFMQRKVVPLALSDPPQVTPVDIVNGCCMMISARVFAAIGLVDERFFLIHEESDFCLRALRAGFRNGVIGEALVWHKGSSAFKRSGKRWQRYYDARNLYLLVNNHAATHRRGRGRLASLGQYVKYVYYRYAVEREEDHADAANAVLEGLCDALAGRYGTYQPRPRWALPILRWVLDRMRGRPRLKTANKEAGTREVAVR